MIHSIRIFSFVVCFASLAASCGGSVTPTEFINNNTELPALSLPVASGGLTLGSTDLRSSAFTFFVNSGTVPIAPASGIVVEQSGSKVTIIHSGRLASRISNVVGLTARVGDRVNAGSPIAVGGQFLNNSFTYEVLLDGVLACPWSFFTTAARSQIQSLGGGLFTSGICNL